MKGWERTRAYPSIWRDAEPEYHIGAGRSDELFCALEVSNLNVERDEPQVVS